MLDRIVLEGDKIFRRIRYNKISEWESNSSVIIDMLHIDQDLATSLRISAFNVHCTIQPHVNLEHEDDAQRGPVFTGPILANIEEPTEYSQNLLTSLSSAFREARYVMVFVMNYTISIFKDSSDVYVLFDSHSRNAAGMRAVGQDGKAITKFFTSIDNIVVHIQNYAIHLGYEEHNACYNIMPFDVITSDTSTEHRSIVYVSGTIYFNEYYSNFTFVS